MCSVCERSYCIARVYDTPSAGSHTHTLSLSDTLSLSLTHTHHTHLVSGLISIRIQMETAGLFTNLRVICR